MLEMAWPWPGCMPHTCPVAWAMPGQRCLHGQGWFWPWFWGTALCRSDASSMQKVGDGLGSAVPGQPPGLAACHTHAQWPGLCLGRCLHAWPAGQGLVLAPLQHPPNLTSQLPASLAHHNLGCRWSNRVLLRAGGTGHPNPRCGMSGSVIAHLGPMPGPQAGSWFWLVHWCCGALLVHPPPHLPLCSPPTGRPLGMCQAAAHPHLPLHTPVGGRPGGVPPMLT